MTLFADDEIESTRDDDIQLVYQTQAALAMLAELLARDRHARLPLMQAARMVVLEHEIAELSPSTRRH